MKIEVKGKEVELKFTYNSFRYMEEFDVGSLENLGGKVFKLIGVTRELLMGAINNEPTNKYSLEDVDKIVEEAVDNGTVFNLSEELMELLSESGFFKSLQQMEAPKTKPKKK